MVLLLMQCFDLCYLNLHFRWSFCELRDVVHSILEKELEKHRRLTLN